MDRTPSADDLIASFLWRTAHHAGGTPGMGFGAPGPGGPNAVVRTASQNEMESYYNAMMANAVAGGSSGALGQDNLIAHAGGGGPPSREGTPGIPRVASMDVLRKMIMAGGLPSGGAGGSGSPGSMTPTTAAAFSAFANGGANLSALGQLGVAAAAEAEAGADAATPARGGTKRGARKTAAKSPAAKKGKAAAKGAAAKGGAKGGGKAAKAVKAEDAGEQHDSDADSRDGADASDIRRQRRMLSNRESARRSRRRKLEHVATLEAQIANLTNDLNAALQHLRTSEMRNAELTRENITLRAEKDRHLQLLRDAGQAGAGVTTPKSALAMERKSSLQRISSNGDIKGELGKGSPSIGAGGGFVPFRSVQSYENLLALQAQNSGKNTA